MKRLIYKGLYYPVIGSSNGFESHSKKQVCEYRIGGWKNADKWWSFSVGVKCLLSNPNKPYEQFVIDEINLHKNMKIVENYYDDCGQIVGGDISDEDKLKFCKLVHVETNNGNYIGDIRKAYYLTNLTDFKTCGGDSTVICVGWDKIEEVAYGWSHRAKCGFRVGDKVFDPKFGDDSTPFTQHGRKTIRNYSDAMKSALEFARYVG